MDPVLITLSPMITYAALCALLGWRNRRTHDPPHIGVIGRVLEPPDDLPPALAAEGKTTPLVPLPPPLPAAQELLELTRVMEQTLRTPA